MSASKFSVQFGLRCNWRISMLKVLHAAICCAQGFSLSELAFAPPFSGIYTHLYLYLFMLFSDIYIYICILCMPTSVYNFSHLSRTFLAHVLRPNFFLPLFQFHFTLPQFHFIAAKKTPETCASFPHPCMFPRSAHLFPH